MRIWNRDLLLIGASAAVGFAGVLVFSVPDKGASVFSTALAGFGPGCNIKGNVSIDSGERIYHVPGQKYYASTKIDSRYGERWFCSEADARSAGWRRSGV